MRAWRARYAPKVRFNREYWFALVLETRRLIRLNPAEHLEYRWLPAAPGRGPGQLLDQPRRHPRPRGLLSIPRPFLPAR